MGLFRKNQNSKTVRVERLALQPWLSPHDLIVNIFAAGQRGRETDRQSAKETYR
jgi:hypothetical protein